MGVLDSQAGSETVREDGEETRQVFEDHVVKGLEGLRREFRDLWDLVENMGQVLGLRGMVYNALDGTVRIPSG